MIRIQKYSYKLLHKKANGPKVPIKGMGQIYLVDDSKKVLSFWNDIPLDLVNSEVTCCIEIPKESCKKLQMTKNFANHPLMQDTRTNLFTKEIELRCYAQFPLFNYGFIPQTWEQNVVKDKDGLYVRLD